MKQVVATFGLGATLALTANTRSANHEAVPSRPGVTTPARPANTFVTTHCLETGYGLQLSAPSGAIEAKTRVAEDIATIRTDLAQLAMKHPKIVTAGYNQAPPIWQQRDQIGPGANATPEVYTNFTGPYVVESTDYQTSNNGMAVIRAAYPLADFDCLGGTIRNEDDPIGVEYDQVELGPAGPITMASYEVVVNGDGTSGLATYGNTGGLESGSYVSTDAPGLFAEQLAENALGEVAGEASNLSGVAPN